jgi:hypothetical protein
VYVRQQADTIAYLRAENERLTKKSDAEMERVKACEHIAENFPGWEVLRNLCPSTAAVAGLQDRAIQAEAAAAAVVGALKYYGNIYHYDGTGVGDGRYDPVFIREDRGEEARKALATLPARALAMAEVVKAAEATYRRLANTLPNDFDELEKALAAYHAKPVSQSEADKGMEKRT